MEEDTRPKVFKMYRDGKYIACGHLFPNGKCIVAWEGEYKSIVIWDSFDDMKNVNGHSNTTFVFY